MAACFQPEPSGGRIGRALAALLLAVLFSISTGCETCREHSLTAKLWRDDAFRSLKSPAPDPHLELFQGASTARVLVVYDEASERTGAVTRRAYFLDTVTGRVENRSKPAFVPVSTLTGMTPITVALADATPVALPFVTYATNSFRFTLHTVAGERGPFSLPIYQDGVAQAERAVLTSFTLAGDVVIVGVGVGLVGGFVAFVSLCAGGAQL